MAAAVVLADTAAMYWFAGVLTMIAAVIVMVVMLTESRNDRAS